MRLSQSLSARLAHQRHRHRVDPARRFFWEAVLLGLVVVLAAAALLIRALRGDGSWLIAAVTVVAAVVAWLGVRRPPVAPHAHQLAGVESVTCPPSPADRTVPVIAVRLVAVALAGAVAFVPSPVVALVLFVVLLVAAAPVLLDLWATWRARRRIRAALAAADVRWALVYGGFKGGPIHVGMWLPYLEASGDAGVIVNLRRQYCAPLREQIAADVPWIQVGSDTLGDLWAFTPPSLRAYFYVHNAPTHLRALANRRVTHVWLGHGDSDKAGSRHRRHVHYDRLVMSGQAAIDRYVDGPSIPRERFVVLGRPQIAEIAPVTVPVAEIARPVVLYAPTWIGNTRTVDFSSIRHGARIVRAIIDVGADVVFRPHPVFLAAGHEELIEPIHAVLAADTADPATPGTHLWGEEVTLEWSVFECMNRSDALVSDVSSVVSDWLASGKPYAMVSMQHAVDDFAEAIPVAAAAYVVDGELANLPEVLDEMLHRDRLAPERDALKQRVLGGFDGAESAEAFAAFVRDLGRHTGSRS